MNSEADVIRVYSGEVLMTRADWRQAVKGWNVGATAEQMAAINGRISLIPATAGRPMGLGEFRSMRARALAAEEARQNRAAFHNDW